MPTELSDYPYNSLWRNTSASVHNAFRTVNVLVCFSLFCLNLYCDVSSGRNFNLRLKRAKIKPRVVKCIVSWSNNCCFLCYTKRRLLVCGSAQYFNACVQFPIHNAINLPNWKHHTRRRRQTSGYRSPVGRVTHYIPGYYKGYKYSHLQQFIRSVAKLGMSHRYDYHWMSRLNSYEFWFVFGASCVRIYKRKRLLWKHSRSLQANYEKVY
jgi:hypothetical protein